MALRIEGRIDGLHVVDTISRTDVGPTDFRGVYDETKREILRAVIAIETQYSVRHLVAHEGAEQ